jgi:thiol-disulfide isomerase/thioredoxin
MKPEITFFYTDDCGKCNELKPLISEFSKPLGIKMINTYEDDLITESYDVLWVPSLVIEDENGKHKFEGVNEIKEVLKKLVL